MESAFRALLKQGMSRISAQSMARLNRPAETFVLSRRTTGRHVVCVDWCVGMRWRERETGIADPVGRLGALRWSSREVVLER